MVLIVTDCFAISTSTSKISPSELCSFMVGMIYRVKKMVTKQIKPVLKAYTNATQLHDYQQR